MPRLDIDKVKDEFPRLIPVSRVAARYTTLSPVRDGKASGLCPLHKEKSPSFTVHDTDGFYYCFGCKEGGDIFNLVKAKENLDFIDSIRFLANQFNIPISDYEVPDEGREDQEGYISLSVYQQVMSTFVEILEPGEAQTGFVKNWFLTGRKVPLPYLDPAPARAFHVPRGGTARVLRLLGADQPGDAFTAAVELGLVVQTEHGLFYPLDNRIVFPVIRSGRILGHSSRLTAMPEVTSGQKPRKYINSNNSPLFRKKAEVYGLDRALALVKETGRPLTVLEGALDVEAMLQSGYPAVAVLGTGVNSASLAHLSTHSPHLALLLDGDAAGQNVTLKLAWDVVNTNAATRLSFIPNNTKLDVDELVAYQGVAGLDTLFKGARDAVDFIIDRTTKNVLANLGPQDKRDTAMVKRLFLNDVLPRLHDYESNPLAYSLMLRISERLSIETLTLVNMLREGVKAAKTTIRREVRNLPDDKLLHVHVIERRLLALVKHHPRSHQRFLREGLYGSVTPLIAAVCEAAYEAHAQNRDLLSLLSRRVSDAQQSQALELYSLATQTYTNPDLEADTIVAFLSTRDAANQTVTGERTLNSLLKVAGKVRTQLGAHTAPPTPQVTAPLEMVTAAALTEGLLDRPEPLQRDLLPPPPRPARPLPTPEPEEPQLTLDPAPWEDDDATFL
jgi:DNA primase